MAFNRKDTGGYDDASPGFRRRVLARRRRRRTTRAMLIGGSILGCVALAAAIVLVIHLPGARFVQPVDMKGNPVQSDGGIPSGATLSAMKPDPDIGQRFEVPSVGLNVPLGALDEAQHNITPPGFTEAYVVRNLGAGLSAPTSGTTYVVMHSIRGGGTGPGNYLINVRDNRAKVKPGDQIQVGNTSFTVKSSELIKKDQLPYASDIWSNVAGRLVVITCMQLTSQAPSVDNLVITAVLSK